MDNLSTIRDVCEQLRVIDGLLPETTITKSDFNLVEQIGRLLIRAAELGALGGKEYAEFRVRMTAAHEPARVAFEAPTLLKLDVDPYEERLEHPPEIQRMMDMLLIPSFQKAMEDGYVKMNVHAVKTPVSNYYVRLKQGLPQIIQMLSGGKKKAKRGDALSKTELLANALFEAAESEIGKSTFDEKWSWMLTQAENGSIPPEEVPVSVASWTKAVQRARKKLGHNIAAKNQK